MCLSERKSEIIKYNLCSAKNGFTLAEVLITLGIIGVVAAMTIPTLISNTTGAKYRSQFKKTLSTLNQAARMAQSQYDFDYAGTTTTCSYNKVIGASEHPDKVMSFCSIFNGTLAGATYYGYHRNIPVKDGYISQSGKNYYQINDVDAKTDWLTNTGSTNFYAYQLADGSIVAFHGGAMDCELPVGTVLTNNYIKTKLANCVGWIDVNGTSLPNKEVRCSSGVNSIDPGSNCIVKNDAQHMNDIFPVVFHDATVEPASGASLYVFKTYK